MAGSTFASTLGKLRTKAMVVQDLGPAALEKLAKLDPVAMVGEVDGLAASNAAQESLKGTRVRRVGQKAATLGQAVLKATATVKVIRGSIEGKEDLDAKGKKGLLKALPKSSTATTEDAKIGFLQDVLAFIVKNPAVSTKVTEDEIAKISSALEASAAARLNVNAAKSAVPLATKDLYEGTRDTAARITAWLDILEGIYVLVEDTKSVRMIRKAREEVRRETAILTKGDGAKTDGKP